MGSIAAMLLLLCLAAQAAYCYGARNALSAPDWITVLPPGVRELSGLDPSAGVLRVSVQPGERYLLQRPRETGDLRVSMTAEIAGGGPGSLCGIVIAQDEGNDVHLLCYRDDDWQVQLGQRTNGQWTYSARRPMPPGTVCLELERRGQSFTARFGPGADRLSRLASLDRDLRLDCYPALAFEAREIPLGVTATSVAIMPRHPGQAYVMLREAAPHDMFTTGDQVVVPIAVVNLQDAPLRGRLQFLVRDIYGTPLWKTDQALALSPLAQCDVLVRPQVKRCGFYVAEARVYGPDGLLDIPRSACFSIVPPLSETPVPPERHPMGLHAGWESPITGARWGRLWDTGHYWSTFEPEPGRWDWSALDATMASAEQAGVSLLLTLAGCPTWASSQPEAQSSYGAGALAPPKRLEDWANYVTRVAERCKGRVRHYEVWNEPNYQGANVPDEIARSGGYFRGTAADYLGVLKTAYEAIKQVDPDAMVWGISGTGDYFGFMDEVLRLGGLAHMDGVAIHTYVFPFSPDDPTAPQGNLVHRINRTQLLLHQYGADKPVWITEMGLWTPGRVDGRPMTATEVLQRAPAAIRPRWTDDWPWRPVDELTGAVHLAKYYTIALGLGVQRFFWHHGFGRQAHFAAYAALSRLLPGCEPYPENQRSGLAGDTPSFRPAGSHSPFDALPSELYVYLFRRGEENVLSLWRSDGKRQQVRVGIGKSRAEVHDIWGNVRPLPLRGEQAELIVGGEPQYLVWRGPRRVPTITPGAVSEPVVRKDPWSPPQWKGTLSSSPSFAPAEKASVRREPSPPQPALVLRGTDGTVLSAGSGEAFRPGTEYTYFIRPDDVLGWHLPSHLTVGRYRIIFSVRSGDRPPGDDWLGHYELTLNGKPLELVRWAPAPFFMDYRGDGYYVFVAAIATAEPVALAPGDLLALRGKRFATCAYPLELHRVP